MRIVLDTNIWISGLLWRGLHRTLFFKDPEGNLLEIYADIEIPEDA